MCMTSRTFVLVLALFVSPSFAVTFGFTNITNNSGVAASLASEFTLDVTESGANVTFTLSNHSSEDAFINQIYWDDNASSLSGFVSLASGYSSPANPANLPAGNTVGFSAGLGFMFRMVGVDYAYVPFADLGDTHRISLKLTF